MDSGGFDELIAVLHIVNTVRKIYFFFKYNPPQARP